MIPIEIKDEQLVRDTIRVKIQEAIDEMIADYTAQASNFDSASNPAVAQNQAQAEAQCETEILNRVREMVRETVTNSGEIQALPESMRAEAIEQAVTETMDAIRVEVSSEISVELPESSLLPSFRFTRT